jgi:6,7-dimethyl-8-ribityllumazine synthase
MKITNVVKSKWNRSEYGDTVEGPAGQRRFNKEAVTPVFKGRAGNKIEIASVPGAWEIPAAAFRLYEMGSGRGVVAGKSFGGGVLR